MAALSLEIFKEPTMAACATLSIYEVIFGTTLRLHKSRWDQWKELANYVIKDFLNSVWDVRETAAWFPVG